MITAYLAKHLTYTGAEVEEMMVPLADHIRIKNDLLNDKAFLESILEHCGITDIDYEKRTFRAPAKPEDWWGVWGTKG